MTAQKRWHVYQGGKSIGLMTAHEIRHALRAGSVDPFDLVALEGSQIKTELVEVDEIFQEDTSAKSVPAPASDAAEIEGDQEAQGAVNASPPSPREVRPAPPKVAAAPPAEPAPPTPRPAPPPAVSSNRPAAPRTPAAKPSVKPSGEGTNPRAPKPAPQQFEFAQQEALQQKKRQQRAAAKNEVTAMTSIPKEESSKPAERSEKKSARSAAAAAAERKKKEKKFYLTDEKNRVLGPLSATEVQSLFYRGILGKTVKVQKSGTNRKIPIRQFISAYSGKRMKALAEDAGVKGGANSPLPSSKVLHELYHLMNSKKLAENRVMWPSIGLMLLGVALGLLLFYLTDNQNGKGLETGRRNAIRKNLIQSDLPESKKPEAEKKAPPKESRPPKIKPRSSVKKNDRPPPSSRRPATTRRTRRVSPPPPAPRTPEPTVAPSRPANTPAPAPPPRGPIANARENAGAVLTVGPLSFSAADLSACQVKCEIDFRDSQGETLTGVFFKGAYAEQLAGKRTVVLTGSSKIQGGKLVLFIQDIR